MSRRHEASALTTLQALWAERAVVAKLGKVLLRTVAVGPLLSCRPADAAVDLPIARRPASWLDSARSSVDSHLDTLAAAEGNLP